MATEVIYCGDNRRVLPKYVLPESVDLVYIDPPFNTGRSYELLWGEEGEQRAFDDRFGDPRQYCEWMEPRLLELYRVLKPTGSFYIHCDPTASHYLKVLLDNIFGWRRFRAEIIWKRSSAHSDGKQGRTVHGRVHDTILFYTKGDDWTWNPVHMAYDKEYIDSHYSSVEPETGRRYQLGDITGPGGAAKGNPSYSLMGVTKHWRFSRERMEELVQQGRIVQPRPGAVPRQKRYLDEMPGRPLQDLWNDIPPVNSQAKERLGWPTQKPLPLLERILATSSNPGDVVLDAFCGCGTSLEAAAKMKRRWIGIDLSPTACRVMAQRLEDRCGLREREHFRLVDVPRQRTELEAMPPFEFQNWAVTALGGIPNAVKTGDFGIDGRLYVVERTEKPLSAQRDLFGSINAHWFPIQVKQRDKVGRPDIDSFQTTVQREGRTRGYFVAFDYTSGARQQVVRAQRDQGIEIVLITVDEILAEEKRLYGEEPQEFSLAQLRKITVQPAVSPAAQVQPPEQPPLEAWRTVPSYIAPGAKPGRRQKPTSAPSAEPQPRRRPSLPA